ncbi:MAG: carbohydrate porin [Rhodocyclales bacterium]|nr:carbohydrate porin [Rhodocyclales bacterium]
MTATAIRLTLLIAVVLTGTAYAADDTPAPNRDGILFEGGLKIDTLRNRGALRDGTRTVSHLDLKLKMDLEKAVGWQGGSAMINVIRDAGRGPNEDLVGSLMGVTNLEVTSPTTSHGCGRDIHQAGIRSDR